MSAGKSEIELFLMKPAEQSRPSYNRFFAFAFDPESVKVAAKPGNGILDMAFFVDGLALYREMKIWADLSVDQLSRQAAFLTSNDSRGVYILLTKAADTWLPDTIAEMSAGPSHIVGNKASGVGLICSSQLSS